MRKLEQARLRDVSRARVRGEFSSLTRLREFMAARLRNATRLRSRGRYEIDIIFQACLFVQHRVARAEHSAGQSIRRVYTIRSINLTKVTRRILGPIITLVFSRFYNVSCPSLFNLTSHYC